MTAVQPQAALEDQPPEPDEGLLRGPLVWLLLDDRPGHVTQVVGLAEALGWPYETKRLRFTPLNRISNRLLGASLVTLRHGAAAQLQPPWPDLVIAMGRRCAPVARWIKRQSGNRTRLVQLGRKGANVAAPFDLAVSCRHFQLPDHPKRVQVLLPPTQVNADRLQDAAARWPKLLDGASAPRVVLLVGGTTAHHRLTAEAAETMAGAVQSFAAGLEGSLTCVTSRRSGQAVESALARGAPGAGLHCWRADQGENPYLGYLAQADILVVTGESESMLAEAAATAKPLFVYPVAARPRSLRARLSGWVLARAQAAQGWRASLCKGLIGRGWVVPPRDLEVLHRGLAEAGLAKPFADAGAPQRPEPHPGQNGLLDRVRLLLERA
ncbi:MAG TPA: nucleoside-diphosphate sugar epimerase [Kiloniellaceae bacterium]|nr:nucleoside-diphosphate sugar epimerase [Kiloniellaceae bacterium]